MRVFRSMLEQNLVNLTKYLLQLQLQYLLLVFTTIRMNKV